MTQPTLAAPPDDEVTIGCPGHLSTPRDWCLFCKLATAKKQRDYARDEAVMFAERVLDTRLQRDNARAAIAEAHAAGAAAMREAAAKVCAEIASYQVRDREIGVARDCESAVRRIPTKEQPT